MTPELQQLTDRLNEVEYKLNQFLKPDRMELWRDLYIRGNRRIQGAVWAGQVDANGAAVSLPTGWTSAKTSTGNYTVTHGLTTANYAVIPVAYATGFNKEFVSIINSQTATTFGVETILGTSSLDANCAFFFIVVLY